MTHLIKLPLLISAFGWLISANFYTECVTIKGHVKNARQQIVKRSHDLLVCQDDYLITTAKSGKNGQLNFDVCLGIWDKPSTVNFFTISATDTLLMASLDGFDSDGEVYADLFLPEKIKTSSCPKCKQSDRIYQLVYKPEFQKGLNKTSIRFYCVNDKVKF
jgi:hypothetical protein